MVDPLDIAADNDNSEQRAEKYRQFNVVLEGCFDLLNGEISDEAWLGQLAELAECDTVVCVWWREHLPETYMASVHGTPDDEVREWVDYLEPALSAARPGETRLVTGLTGSDRMLRPDHMVYCLDHSPVRVIFIFSHCRHQDAWSKGDQERLLRVMKVIDKPIRAQRRQAWLSDIVDLSNKFMDEMPRALLVLTPDGEIVSVNRLAQKLVDRGDLMQVRKNKLILADRAKNAELKQQLDTVLHLPQDSIEDYVWHKNLSDSTEPGSCMLAMLCFPFDNWKLESSARDRVVVMVIQLMDRLATPPVSQLSEFYNLTRSQCNVVAQLLEGNSVEATAENLHVSINTVRTHLRAIYSKLGVDNKTQLLQRIAGTITGPADI